MITASPPSRKLMEKQNSLASWDSDSLTFQTTLEAEAVHDKNDSIVMKD